MVPARVTPSSNVDVVPVEQNWRQHPALSRCRAGWPPCRRIRRPLLPVLIVLHQETLDTRPGRQCAARARSSPRHPPARGSAMPLPETLDEHAGAVIFGGPMSANDPRRLCSPRDRLDRSSPARAAAVSGHLPGRPDARQATRRTGRAASAKAARRSAITRSARPPPATRSARTGRSASITGIARVRTARRRRTAGRGRRLSGAGVSARARLRLPVSSRRDLRDDASLDHARAASAWTRRARIRAHQHFAGRAVHDVTERAWLKNFIDGWLARMPRVGHVGSRGIAAARNFAVACSNIWSENSYRL